MVVSHTETILACLTPHGTGAIATLGVHGFDAWQIVRPLFTAHSATMPTALADVQPGSFWLGRLGQEMHDEVVLAVKRKEPVPWVEIHCHGGREVLKMLVELFEQGGVRSCSWEQWEQVSSRSPLQASATLALSQAPTTRTASILLDQYQGAFETTLNQIETALAQDNLAEAGSLLASLVRWATLGQHLTTPWRVVVAGAPNVGKSSLVNALAGYQRSIVSELPGTTRDVVTTVLAIDGWPIELTDTAGLRTQAETLEREGIQRARASLERADLCLWVLDASEPPVWPETTTAPFHYLVNKVDLRPVWDLSEAAGALHLSARTGEGLQELCEALSRWLVPEVPSSRAAVPFTREWCERVELAHEQCASGRGVEARQTLLQP